MVLADSHDTPRTSYYSGNDHGTSTCFVYGTVTHCGQGSHPVRLHPPATAVSGRTPRPHPTTPTMQPLPGLTHDRFSHLRVRSPLLTESLLFSLPAGTEMFHFPTFPPTRLYIHPAVTHQPNGLACGVSPFGHPGLTVWLSTPPGLSQIPTSFIGSYCQGIHRALLQTSPTTTHNRWQPDKPNTNTTPPTTTPRAGSNDAVTQLSRSNATPHPKRTGCDTRHNL